MREGSVMGRHPPSLRIVRAVGSDSRAFTLVELLVSISIISILISVLLPAVGSARERAKATFCLAQIRGIGQMTQMYLDDDELGLVQWYTYPKHPACVDPNRYTPWVFGGFAAPSPRVEDLLTDSSLYPAEVRPLNRLVDPTAEGMSVQIDLYKCPSDSSSYTPTIGQAASFGSPLDDGIDLWPAWVAYGSSFTLNTRFMLGYNFPSFNFDLDDADDYAVRIVPHMSGGKASRFIMWTEQGFYSRTHQSAQTLNQSLAAPQRRGWHGQFSRWTVGYADGHVEYDYFDTRLSGGADWTIWQPE